MYYLGKIPQPTLGRCTAIKYLILEFLLGPVFYTPVRGGLVAGFSAYLVYKLFPASELGLNIASVFFSLGIGFQWFGFAFEFDRGRRYYVSEVRYVLRGLVEYPWRRKLHLVYNIAFRLTIEGIVYLFLLAFCLVNGLPLVVGKPDVYLGTIVFALVGIVLLFVGYFVVFVPVSKKLEENKNLCPTIGEEDQEESRDE